MVVWGLALVVVWGKLKGSSAHVWTRERYKNGESVFFIEPNMNPNRVKHALYLQIVTPDQLLPSPGL